jgi:hypothetical protein
MPGDLTPSVSGERGEDQNRRQALVWPDGTRDIFRRIKPGTPDPHPVSHFLPTDHARRGCGAH